MVINMVEFLRADYPDYAELCDEANRIFTEKPDENFEYDKTYFQDLLPKLYGDPSRMPEHYIAREDGKIVAEVGAFHCPVNVCDDIIENRGIGTVGVDYSKRGKGYMIKLMNMAADDMKKDGVAFSALGGLRFRYEHFGYYPSGIAVHYSYGYNCHKYLYGDRKPEFTFRKAEKDGKDIENIIALYNKNSVKAVRPDKDFYNILITWKQEITVIEKDGEFSGYTVGNGNTVNEIELTDISLLSDVTEALFLKNDCEINFEIPAYDVRKNKILSDICQSCSVGSSEMIRVFSHKKTLSAYLKAKAAISPLPDFRFAVNIAGREKLLIEAENGVSNVEEFNGKYDAELTEKEATMILYGNYPTLRTDIPSVFPLPLFVASVDKV